MTRQSSDGSITGPLHLPYVTSSYIKDLSHFNLKIKTNPTENKKEWNTTVQIVPLKDSGCFGVCLLLIKLRQTDKNKRQPTKRRWGNVKSEEWPSNRVDEIKERERETVLGVSRDYTTSTFSVSTTACLFWLHLPVVTSLTHLSQPENRNVSLLLYTLDAVYFPDNIRRVYQSRNKENATLRAAG